MRMQVHLEAVVGAANVDACEQSCGFRFSAAASALGW